MAVDAHQECARRQSKFGTYRSNVMKKSSMFGTALIALFVLPLKFVHAAENLSEALSSGTVYADFLMRYESVEQSNVLADAFVSAAHSVFVLTRKVCEAVLHFLQ